MLLSEFLGESLAALLRFSIDSRLNFLYICTLTPLWLKFKIPALLNDDCKRGNREHRQRRKTVAFKKNAAHPDV
jgi:hypothetical protein